MQHKFFDSASEAKVRVIHIKPESSLTPEARYATLAAMRVDKFGILPEIHIWGGANPELIKLIHPIFNTVTLRNGVDEIQTANLPMHIKNAEIFFGVKPSGIAHITNSVESLIFSGATTEMIRSVPARYYQIGLRRDITPEAMSAIADSVERVNILGPISTTALQQTPHTVKAIYFKGKKLNSDSYFDDQNNCTFPTAQLLNAVPNNIKGIGIIGEMKADILKFIPPHFKFLHVMNNYDDTDFAKAIPNFMERVLITRHHSKRFIDAVSNSCEIMCEIGSSNYQTQYVAYRNAQRQQNIAYENRRGHKRPTEQAPEVPSPAAKKFRKK